MKTDIFLLMLTRAIGKHIEQTLPTEKALNTKQTLHTEQTWPTDYILPKFDRKTIMSDVNLLHKNLKCSLS